MVVRPWCLASLSATALQAHVDLRYVFTVRPQQLVMVCNI